LKELHFNRQGQSHRGPDVGPSELLEGTICSSYSMLFTSKARWRFLNSFLMMTLFVYVTVLPFSFPDEKLQFSQMG